MIRSSTTFMRIISHRYALLIAVDCFYCGININHNTRQNPNHAAAEPKHTAPDTDPNSVIKSFHLVDVLLRKSTQNPAEVRSSGILRQPAARHKTWSFQTVTTERVERAPPIIPTMGKRITSTASYNPVVPRWWFKVCLIIDGKPCFYKNFTTGIKPACAVRSFPPWMIWMFWTELLDDFVLW